MPLVKTLYTINGIVAILLYLPQILKAAKGGSHARSMSLISFGGWSVGALITALYAWLIAHDPIFTTISLGHMTGAGTIFILIIAGRIKERGSAAGNKADRAAGLAEQFFQRVQEIVYFFSSVRRAQ